MSVRTLRTWTPRQACVLDVGIGGELRPRRTSTSCGRELVHVATTLASCVVHVHVLDVGGAAAGGLDVECSRQGDPSTTACAVAPMVA